MEQHDFDTLADDLVEKNTLVSYETVQAALRERNREPGEAEGRGVSYRDMKDPLKRWKDRRRYKGHLVTLDLPEKMEKLIASFATQAIKVAETKVRADQEKKELGLLEQAQRRVGELDGKVVALTDENRRLQKEITGLREAAAARPVEPEAVPAARRSPGGRKVKGIAASTAYHFWDRVALRVAALIRASEDGRMTIHELVGAIDMDTKILAKAAFAEITPEVLANRLWDREKANRYRLHKEGKHYVLEKVDKKTQAPGRAA